MMRSFILLLILTCMLPILHAVVCIIDNSGNTYDNCKYCGFANITSYNQDDGSSAVYHQCLREPLVSAGGYSSNLLNKCYYDYESKPQEKTIVLYLCDFNSCNIGYWCPGTPTLAPIGVNVAGIGLGFTSFISAVFIAY